MRLFLTGSLGIIFCLCAVLVWNAQSCRAPETKSGTPATTKLPQFDREVIAHQLSQAIQIATVSQEHKASDDLAFDEFQHLLKQQFPLVHQRLEYQTINRHSLLYHWRHGTNSQHRQPILLMAHMDVVPATAADWQHPPFAGEIDADTVWGRGALDDKGALITLLHATETLLAEGFQPQRDIYFAFGHDEEISGRQGAAKIAALFADRFKARQQRFAAVLDEGGMIAKDMLPGMKHPLAAIGPGEKGYLTVRLTATGTGGHSSMPGSDSAITRLNQALLHIENNPFPPRFSLVADLIHTIAGQLSFVQRLVLCNPWAFEDLITSYLSKIPALNASMRTTAAVTELSAGFKENVIPGQAEAVINLRLLPGMTIADALQHLNTIIHDEHVRLTVMPGAKTAGEISDVSGKAYQWVAESLRMSSDDKNLMIAPRLVTAATDSSYYYALSDNIFRFVPFTITPETLEGIHGANERVSKQDLLGATRFYYLLLKNSDTML